MLTALRHPGQLHSCLAIPFTRSCLASGASFHLHGTVLSTPDRNVSAAKPNDVCLCTRLHVPARASPSMCVQSACMRVGVLHMCCHTCTCVCLSRQRVESGALQCQPCNGRVWCASFRGARLVAADPASVTRITAARACMVRPRRAVQGVVGKLAAITVASEGQESPHLPDASIAALSNTVNNATQAIREELMSKLPWPRVRAMLAGDTTQVTASAWSFLQNLSHSSDVAPIQRPVLQWSQGELLAILYDVIRGTLCRLFALRGVRAQADGSPCSVGGS